MLKKQRLLLLLVMLVGPIVVSACGARDGDPPAQPGSSQAPAGSEASETPEVGAADGHGNHFHPKIAGLMDRLFLFLLYHQIALKETNNPQTQNKNFISCSESTQ